MPGCLSHTKSERQLKCLDHSVTLALRKITRVDEIKAALTLCLIELEPKHI